MDEFKRRSWMNLIVVVAVVVIFTIYKMNSGSAVSSTIGIDDEKIGITLEDGSAMFIELSDVEDVEYLDNLDDVTTEYTMIGDESQGAYIYIETDDENYVINAATKATTWQTYKDIMENF